jgi:hypothetical protein
MSRQDILDRLCREHGLLAVYLFGSRAGDGLQLLEGEDVSSQDSILDVGIVFKKSTEAHDPVRLQADFEDVFSPSHIHLVTLQSVDALVQFSAIDGHRVATTDADEADKYELIVMNLAEEMVWLQRQIENENLNVVDTTSIPDNERWLHEPVVKAKLDRALARAAANPPSETDLAELEKKILGGR